MFGRIFSLQLGLTLCFVLSEAASINSSQHNSDSRELVPKWSRRQGLTVNLNSLFNRLYGPDTFLSHMVVATTLLAFRTVPFLVSGAIQLLLDSQGLGFVLVNIFGDFYSPENFLFSIGRNVRNWTFVLLGRLVFSSLLYGPVVTLQELFLGQMRMGTFLRNSRLFLTRMMHESAGLTVGFAALTLLGGAGVFGSADLATAAAGRRSAEDKLRALLEWMQ